MNKLEELHKKAVESKIFIDTKKNPLIEFTEREDFEFINGIEETATKSAEITEQIAIEFAEWIDKNNFKKFDIFENQMSCTHYKYQKWGKSHINSFTIEEEDTLTTKELFQEFLKQRQ